MEEDYKIPSSKGYKRDYKAEYANAGASEKQKKERAARNRASRNKGAGPTDVDHITPLRDGGSTRLSNTKQRSVHDNRSDNGHHKGEKQVRRNK